MLAMSTLRSSLNHTEWKIFTQPEFALMLRHFCHMLLESWLTGMHLEGSDLDSGAAGRLLVSGWCWLLLRRAPFEANGVC